MLMNIFGIIVAIFVLGILVAVHEAGHLLMAKWSNIRVDVFSVGMGKPIWGKQFGETFYQIGQLPFGGFCAFGKEENGDAEDTDPRALPNSPLWARLLTIIGGSLFNLIFAYLVLVILFGIGFKEKQLANVVLVPQTITVANEEIRSPAYEAGLRNGDRIIQVNGEKVEYFIQIPLNASLNSESGKEIQYVRDNQTNKTTVMTIVDRDTGLDLIGIYPVQPSIISEVITNTPAEQAGLMAEDEIISINGIPVSFFYQVQNEVEKGEMVTIEYIRADVTNSTSLTPMTIDGSYKIGIRSEFPYQIEIIQKADNDLDAFALAGKNMHNTLSQIVISLQKLFTGQVDVQKNLSGPVRIVSITGEIAQTFDLSLLVKFMVMLSIALAVFNLLPFPGLDGGAIILQTARSIFKDNAKAAKLISIIENIGVFLLLAMAVFVMFNDIKNLFIK